MTSKEPAIDEALLSRLELIEVRPLEQRADAYASLADELERMLASADQPTTGGAD
ncbi:MAG: hypothetical protein Q7U41_00585 [Microbacterium sp.]|nr:hypothetical protein [Microbacterium sp.]